VAARSNRGGPSGASRKRGRPFGSKNKKPAKKPPRQKNPPRRAVANTLEEMSTQELERALRLKRKENAKDAELFHEAGDVGSLSDSIEFVSDSSDSETRPSPLRVRRGKASDECDVNPGPTYSNGDNDS